MKKTYLISICFISIVLSCKKSSDDTKPTPTPIGNPPTVDFSYFEYGSYSPVFVQFTNASINADSYSWDYVDGITSTEKDPIHQYTTGGTFNVKLTATNSNGVTTKIKIVTITPTPTSAKISQLNITAYPILNSTGSGWDNPNTPDNYFQLADSIGNIIYNGAGSIAFNIDGSFLPYTWTFPIPQSMTYLNSAYYIVFYDYDAPPSPPQFMGNLIFKLSDYTSSYPSSIYLNQNNFDISLDVTWQ